MISEILTLDRGKEKKKGEFGLDTENVRAYLKQETNFFSSLDNPGKKK